MIFFCKEIKCMQPWHLNFYRSLVVSLERCRKLLTLRYPSLGVTVSTWNKIILTSDLIRHFKKRTDVLPDDLKPG